MSKVFNMGIGMIVTVAPGSVAAAIDALDAGGHHARVIGEITPGSGQVHVR